MMVHPFVLCLPFIIGDVPIANMQKIRGVAAFTGPSLLLMLVMIHADFGFSLTHTILQIIDFLTVFLDTPILSNVVGLQGANAVPQFLDYDF